MLTRVRLCLTEPEFRALQAVAVRELRPIDSQILWILRQELNRRGLLIEEFAMRHDSVKISQPSNESGN